MSTRYSTLSPKNTSNDFPKCLETSHDKIIHNNSNFHTYTNVDLWKNSQKCLAPKPNIPKQKFNQFHTFLRTSAPFNYYPEKNGYVVYYNGGLVKEFRPLVSRQDLAKYLRNNGSLIKTRKRCFSSFKSNKSNNFCSRGYRANCMCNFLRRSENREQNGYPFLGYTPVNKRIFSPNCSLTSKNKGKITYKLKNNNNNTFNAGDESYFQNECIKRNYSSGVNNNMNNYNEFSNEMNDQIDNRENLNNNMKVVNDNNNGMKMSKRDQILNHFNSNSFSVRPKSGRRFHKVQIFNNYKPFLVDDFKDYADYQ